MLAYGSVPEKIAVLSAIDEILLARYHTPEDHQRITRAVRLSYRNPSAEAPEIHPGD